MRRDKLLAENQNALILSKLKNENLNDLPIDFHFTQIWKVIPCETPKIIRKCTRCNADRFRSADKFRVNANKKILDAWLIYKCIQCDFTLKLSIFRRTTVSKIESTLLQRLQENDQLLAWQYAFDTNLHNGMQLDWEIDFEIQLQPFLEPSGVDLNTPKRHILINSEYFLKISIFAILRKKLEMSRNQLQKYEKEGVLKLYTLKGSDLSLKHSLGMGCILNTLPSH